jgi:hypothetical protein
VRPTDACSAFPADARLWVHGPLNRTTFEWARSDPMKFIHRIGFRATASQRKELEALGLKLPAGIAMPGGGNPFVAFDLGEDQAYWQQVCVLLKHWNVGLGQTRTEFSAKEIGSALWLEIGAWHHGYPQPDEDNFGYLEATYDLTDWCDKCGLVVKQKAPFQMKCEPRWGRRGLLQLNWVYGELFATREVWSKVFRPKAIGCRPVLNKKGFELRTVVQLVIDEEVSIGTEGLPYETCQKCRRAKYLPHVRGPFPGLLDKPSRSMVRTQEYFGSGAEAHTSVLVSQELAQLLTRSSVRGASLWPVQGQGAETI